jgi:hypothetical protein
VYHKNDGGGLLWASFGRCRERFFYDSPRLAPFRSLPQQNPFTAAHCYTASLSSTTIQDAGIPRYCPDLQLRVSFDVHSPLNKKLLKSSSMTEKTEHTHKIYALPARGLPKMPLVPCIIFIAGKYIHAPGTRGIAH